MTMDGEMIRVAGLSREFAGRPAVRELSFTVPRGELFGIVGPDGAGKTTTLRMLAGVLRPTSGDAWIDGASVRADPEGVKAGIAYMAQRFGMYTDLTVRENIDFYADLYRVPVAERRRRVARLHEFSGLGPFENRLAGQLSGGMQQKLSLSCALIHEPRVLLLDEPTFGVDPISRRDLWLILHETVGRGVTVVASTAYLDEAERCDRVLLLQEGRAAAVAPPAELQASLAGRVLALATARPREVEQALRGLGAVASAAAFGDRVHLTLARDGTRAQVEVGLRAAGIDAEGLEEVTPSLEDVFLELMLGQATG